MANLSGTLFTPSILQTDTKKSLAVGTENKSTGKSSLLKSNVKPLALNNYGTATLSKDAKSGNLMVHSSTTMGSLSLSSSLLSSSLLQPAKQPSSVVEKTMKNEEKKKKNKKPKSSLISDLTQKKMGSLLKEPSCLMTVEMKSPGGLNLTSSSKLLTSSLLTKASAKPSVSPSSLSMTSSSLSSSAFGMKLDGTTKTSSTMMSSLSGHGFESILKSTISSGVKKDHLVCEKREKSAKKKVPAATPGLATAETHWESTMEKPQYSVERIHVDERKIPTFLTPEQEVSFLQLQAPLQDVQAMKVRNCCLCYLIAVNVC